MLILMTDWNGASPGCADTLFQHAGCPDGESEIAYSSHGFGGDQPCLKGYKSFCCSKPAPFRNCQWYKHEGGSYFGNPLSCNGQCPPSQQLIATDTGSCIYGYQVLCCDPPPSMLPRSPPNLLELLPAATHWSVTNSPSSRLRCRRQGVPKPAPVFQGRSNLSSWLPAIL
jgi:hypothetical protein